MNYNCIFLLFTGCWFLLGLHLPTIQPDNVYIICWIHSFLHSKYFIITHCCHFSFSKSLSSSSWWNEIRIPSIHSHVSTTRWLHLLNFNETLGEKSRRKLHEDAVCCFEQIPKAAHYKTAAVQPHTAYLTNHLSKMSKTCLRSKDEIISDIFLWTTKYGHTSVGQLVKTYIIIGSAHGVMVIVIENGPGDPSSNPE